MEDVDHQVNRLKKRDVPSGLAYDEETLPIEDPELDKRKLNDKMKELLRVKDFENFFFEGINEEDENFRM